MKELKSPKLIAYSYTDKRYYWGNSLYKILLQYLRKHFVIKPNEKFYVFEQTRYARKNEREITILEQMSIANGGEIRVGGKVYRQKIPSKYYRTKKIYD